jgi:hypothetical protein
MQDTYLLTKPLKTRTNNKNFLELFCSGHFVIFAQCVE